MSHRASAAAARLAAVLALVLMVLAPSVARAVSPYGLDLGWDACGVLGVANRDFACDVNSVDDVDVLVASFVPSAAVANAIGASARIDVRSPVTMAPSYWWWDAAGCRTASIQASAQLPPSTACARAWRGAPLSLVTPTYVFDLFNARVLLDVDVFYAGVTPVNALVPGTEYAAFELIVDHAQTVGPDRCYDCDRPACLTFVGCRIHRSDSPADDMVLAGEHRRWWVSWQGGYYGGPTGCARAVPARATTWGAIKSMYR